MTTEIKNEKGIDYLVISIPIKKRPSKTGKTMIVASSDGNKPTAAMIDGKTVTVGLNAYIPIS